MVSHDDRRHWLVLSLLLLASGSYAFAQTAILPGFTELGHALNTDAAGVAWTATAFFLAAAPATPLFGRLGDMFGKRRMLIVALLIFAAGSALAAVGDSVATVVVGRAVQGTGGGILPLCFGVARDELPPERVRSSIALISATMGIGGGIGLPIGGLLVDHASWQWIFWTGAAACSAAAVGVWIWVPRSRARPGGRVDVGGAVLLIGGLVTTLFGISRANAWGATSPATLALVATGAVILAGWVVLERRTSEPLVNVTSLLERGLALTNVVALLSGIGMSGAWFLTPQLLSAPLTTGYGFGSSATTAGLLLLPGSIAMMVTGSLAGPLATRYGNRATLSWGAGLTATGLALLGMASGSPALVALWYAVLMMGSALSFAALPNLIIDQVSAAHTGEATGVNALSRLSGSSLGAQLAGAALAASVVGGSSLPTKAGFVTAYLVSGVASVLALFVSLRIPARRAAGEKRVASAAAARAAAAE